MTQEMEKMLFEARSKMIADIVIARHKELEGERRKLEQSRWLTDSMMNSLLDSIPSHSPEVEIKVGEKVPVKRKKFLGIF